MWSELFFLNLREIRSHFQGSLDIGQSRYQQVELSLFRQLATMKEVSTVYVQQGRQFPPIEIKECAWLRRDHLMVPNASVVFDPTEYKFTVCQNYSHN